LWLSGFDGGGEIERLALLFKELKVKERMNDEIRLCRLRMRMKMKMNIRYRKYMRSEIQGDLNIDISISLYPLAIPDLLQQ